jgi:hypothetical protein
LQQSVELAGPRALRALVEQFERVLDGRFGIEKPPAVLNESGVTLTMPITSVRRPSSSARADANGWHIEFLFSFLQKPFANTSSDFRTSKTQNISKIHPAAINQLALH